MTPAARIAAAIGLLDDWEAAFERDGARATPLDAQLSAWARANRYAGARDRAAIADLVHDGLRRRRSLTAVMAGASASPGRAMMLARLVLDGETREAITRVFSGEGYGPTALTPEEAARLDLLAAPDACDAALDALTAAERGDWPDWLWDALAASTADPEAEASAVARRGAFDCRVNRLKAAAATAIAALAEQGVEAAPGPLSPDCLRIEGHPRVARLAPFTDGWLEPQDAASQATALLAAAATEGAGPVVDYCAGGGGKTLALAAEARSTGMLSGRRIFAHDVDPRRMADLPQRLARAKASVDIRSTERLEGIAGGAALVFVDAPCSGSGAWARETEAKWRLTPERLQRLGAAQRDALGAGARLVAPGGALAYVTCSVLAVENEAVADWFEAAFPAFKPLSLGPLWRRAGLRGDRAPDEQARWRFSPAQDGAGGFFIALWRRDGEKSAP